MGKSSGPEAAVVVVVSPQLFFFFLFSLVPPPGSCVQTVLFHFFWGSSFHPIFIRNFPFFFLSASQRFHSNDAQWIAHLSTKSDGAIEKEKGGKNPPTLFSSFFLG